METRRFAADDLREVSVCDRDGKSVVLKAENGVIEVTKDTEPVAVQILEGLAASDGHPIYETEPKGLKKARE